MTLPKPSPRWSVLLVAALLSLPAAAEPPAPAEGNAAAAPAGDAVLQLLQDKGLLAKPATPAPETTPPTAVQSAVQSAAHTAAQIQALPLVQQLRDSATELVMASMNFLGVRYVRGGSDAEGFDCSGFTRYVFEHSLGLVLPRRADEQARKAGLMDVKKTELKPGDLVFFNTMRRAFSHVGIYIGDGRFIHAPRSGAEVRIEDMRAAYWARRFNGARRADIPPPPTPPGH